MSGSRFDLPAAESRPDQGLNTNSQESISRHTGKLVVIQLPHLTVIEVGIPVQVVVSGPLLGNIAVLGFPESAVVKVDICI